MIQQYISEYRDLGISVVPIEWDVEKKQPVSHRLWSGDATYLNDLPKHNAMMIKTDGCFACLDFDIKNTERKTIFSEWKAIVLNQQPDLWNKLYIEKTRNSGYHVWLNYPKLEKKLSLADSDKGSEVIALYAKGPLVYTFPTPGYSIESGSMEDIQELTHNEFEYIINTSQAFNEYSPDYDPNKKAISYPKKQEAFLSEFDKLLPDDAWVELLSQIGLVKIDNYKYGKKDKFVAFRRIGSASDAISAKVYFKTKRVLIFSASLHDYPNWHNKHNYPVWSLPPSFVLFYKNKRDWDAAITEIKTISESIGLDINVKPASSYPLHVFPEIISKSILDVSQARSLAPEFVATAGLWTISSLAGTMYHSDFNSEGKNILFCIMIAPVSVGKTPAFKVMCETPLQKSHEQLDKRYNELLDEWQKKKSQAQENKQPFNEKKPFRYIPIAVDGTTEGYIHKSMQQPNGIGVYQDEAETILNAGNFKSTNDAISFFTQAFTGGRVAQIRADETKERVVPNLNMNLLMGTQPIRLKNIFTEDRLSSGFASRFLMVESDYIELNEESDPFGDKKEMCNEWVEILSQLFHHGQDFNAGNTKQINIPVTPEARGVYRKYYRTLLTEANSRIQTRAESYVIGTEAKMAAYFPRLTQILAIIHDHTGPAITEDIVHKGYELYRYYAESTIRIIASLHGEIETGLPKDLELLYQRRFDVSIRRKDFKALFVKSGQGQYRKV
jgi:hypothetical protein